MYFVRSHKFSISVKSTCQRMCETQKVEKRWRHEIRSFGFRSGIKAGILKIWHHFLWMRSSSKLQNSILLLFLSRILKLLSANSHTSTVPIILQAALKHLYCQALHLTPIGFLFGAGKFQTFSSFEFLPFQIHASILACMCSSISTSETVFMYLIPWWRLFSDQTWVLGTNSRKGEVQGMHILLLRE